MKKDIHPELHTLHITCGCGAKIETHSTLASKNINIEVCSKCHPFYTGQQKIVDTGGRVDRFKRRFQKKTDSANPS
jgi:large subunit ribosomal protein L31